VSLRNDDTFVCAGAVVTMDVPDYAMVVGNPARQKGWMSRHGVFVGIHRHLPPPFERGGKLAFPGPGRYVVESNGEKQSDGTDYRLDGPRMKTAARRELSQFIVSDPRICGGKPTFIGTRVTVADVLADVQRGLSWDFICYRWGDGKISKDAIAEAVQLARRALLDADGHLAQETAAAA
jgi:uncharacterized protein (DUF433 family)